MNKARWRALTRGEKLYFTQFALVGAAFTACILNLFGFSALPVAVATGALTVVSFVRGQMEKDYLSFVLSALLFISSVALVVVHTLGW